MPTQRVVPRILFFLSVPTHPYTVFGPCHPNLKTLKVNMTNYHNVKFASRKCDSLKFTSRKRQVVHVLISFSTIHRWLNRTKHSMEHVVFICSHDISRLFFFFSVETTWRTNCRPKRNRILPGAAHS